MNKKLLFPLALVPLAATSLQAQKSAQTQRVDKRPNIILFMVDDMGWQDTSLPFWTQKTDYNQLYETPNMERLAKQGKVFETERDMWFCTRFFHLWLLTVFGGVRITNRYLSVAFFRIEKEVWKLLPHLVLYPVYHSKERSFCYVC